MNKLFSSAGRALLIVFAVLLAVGMVFVRISPVLAENAPDAAVSDDGGATDGAPDAVEPPKDAADASADGSDTLTTGAESEEEDPGKGHVIMLAVIGGVIALAFVALIVFLFFNKKDKLTVTTKQLVESALMIAVATVCSIVKIDLPFGGGITVVSMLPLILISHRYGWKWGITTAFVYSLIQLALGLDNVGYATSTVMAFGVIFLDYIVAYTVIGLSGVFGKSRKAVVTGILVTFFLRFACHYVTGVWIWREWMPETFMGMKMVSPWIYSALYNGWYMLIELVIHIIVAMLIYKPLEKFFTGEDIKA